MNRTPIQWADFSSNPIKARHRETGKQGWACMRVSPGCTNCYAATLNRRLGTGLDFTVPALSQVEPFLDEKELHKMLTFRPKGPFKNGRSRPAVFVCDMTDLWGEWVPDEWIDRLFAVFALRPDVDWLLLTKRPARMRAWFDDQAKEAVDGLLAEHVAEWEPIAWPLPNVWLGVSVEDQERADIRVPILLATPAAVRFISAEPLLGAVDLRIAAPDWGWPCPTCEASGSVPVNDNGDRLASWDFATGGAACPRCENASGALFPDWVIVGGESGPKARPMDIAWARSLRDQCQAAGVPVFVKQLGRRPVSQFLEVCGQSAYVDGEHWGYHLRDLHGGDMSEWHEDLRVREAPR